MSDNNTNKNPPSRTFAYLILLICSIALAFTMPMTLQGNWQGALQVCAGTIVVLLLILVIGGFVVASNRSGNNGEDV